VTTPFSSLGLAPAVLANLAALGYHEMTPIQAASLPGILAGDDLIAQARTGSGKTAAFGIGLLGRVDPRRPATQAIVLCPTRELAEQVAVELRKLARPLPNLKLLVLCGGVPLGPQLGSLRHGAHVVVGTPGRIGKHLRTGTLVLGEVAVVVLDEGDRMLDMGFADDILAIVEHTPASRQTLLFSATYPAEIGRISASIQRAPRRVSVDEAHDAVHIEQHFHEVAPGEARSAIARVLAHHRPAAALLFCNTRERCASLARELHADGIGALAIHGELEQRDRDRVLTMFANGSCRVLVATDVAARGLDIKELPAVVNVELPLDPEVYVHRIGRTGRAGASGLAVSLFAPSELARVRAIEAIQRIPARVEPLPVGEDLRGPEPAARVTLCIHGGRKHKLRAGDVLGALTNAGGIDAAHIGKIDVGERMTYVAVQREQGARALAHLQRTPIKGRRLEVELARA
jgi:ATP-dependent RNA helicase DbpA